MGRTPSISKKSGVTLTAVTGSARSVPRRLSVVGCMAAHRPTERERSLRSAKEGSEVVRLPLNSG